MYALLLGVSHGSPDQVIDVLVAPGWGFQGFLLGAMVSLAMSHIILAVHRYCVEDMVFDEFQDKEALCMHTVPFMQPFGPPQKQKQKQMARGQAAGQHGSHDFVEQEEQGEVEEAYLYCSAPGRFCCFVVISGTLAAVALGVYFNSFTFTFEGLAGYILGKDAIQNFSAITLGEIIPSSSGSPDSVGIRWIQVW